MNHKTSKSKTAPPSGTVRIVVRGSVATSHNVSLSLITEALSVPSPDRERSLAYQQNRWDGMIPLNMGRTFPAGLSTRLRDFLVERGFDVKVLEPALDDLEPLDFSRLTPDYLPGITMWAHQFDAVSVLLRNLRGCVKLPTGSGKTEVMATGARFLWEERSWRSLVITSRRDLISQTVERFSHYYEGDVRVGQAGDSVKDFHGCPVVVASAQTLLGYKPRQRKVRGKNERRSLAADLDLRAMLESYEVLWLDEAHHASSDSWFEISQFSNAICRYGLSGTPLKNDALADSRLIGATGPLLLEVGSEKLVSLGLVAKPKILMVMSDAASGPSLPSKTIVVMDKRTRRPVPRVISLPYKEAYVAGIVENAHHNAAVIRAVSYLVDKGRKVLLISRRKAHYLTLRQMLEDVGISYVSAWGDTETQDRKWAKADFVKGGASVMLATTIFDEGTDVPGIDALVLAEGVKINTNVLQRIGRGMRRKSGDNDVLVVDFVPTCHPRLMEHALIRCETYEAEGFDVAVVESWPHKDEDFDGDLLPFSSDLFS